MKRKLFFKLFVFAVIAAFVTVTSCKDYDDDIKRLEGQISGVQTELPSKIDAVKTELNTAMNAKIKTVTDGIAELKGKLADLVEKGATKAELDAVKKEIIEKTVALEAYNAFKAKTEADLNELSGKITALTSEAATKKELADAKKALQDAINELEAKAATKEELKKEVADAKKILEEAISNLEAKAATKEELADAKKALEKLINDLEAKAATKEALKAEVEKLTTALKDVKDALVKDLNAYKTEVAQKFNEIEGRLNAMGVDLTNLTTALNALRNDFNNFIGDYDGNVQGIFDKITDLKNELSPRIDVLEAILKVNKEGESETIKDIYEKLGEQLAKIESNKTEIAAVKDSLQAKYAELQGMDQNLQAQINSLKDSVAQHRTDINTNAGNIKLNKGDIATINKYINDELKPELSRLNNEIVKLQERMNKVEEAVNLNADNILVLSSRVSELTLIPTRGLFSGEKAIKLYWNAGDYSADQVLMYRVSPASARVGRDFTVESLNYQITTRSAIDDNASNVDIEINGRAYMHPNANGVLCVPVHLKGKNACDVFHVGIREALTLVLTVKNNSITPSYKDITKPENGKDEVDSDNVYVKSSEMVYTEYIHNDILLAELGEGTLAERLLETTEAGAKAFANKPEVETPEAKRNWNAMLYKLGQIDLNDYVLSYYVDEDGQKRFYNNLGEFGKPYTDKPVYAKPIYKFEIVAEWQGSDPHFIDPQDRYTELVDGSILKVKEGKVNSADDKKVIVKVTQVNTKCVERQPVAYLVVKITNDPGQVWADIHHTFDLTAYPYIHSDEDGYVNNPDDFKFGKNPADIDVVLDKFPVGAIKKEEFWNSTYVTGWPSNMDYVKGSAKFKAFGYNHVSLDTIPNEALQYITFKPTKTWGAGDEYQVNSILVKVDKRAPAGMYEVTYKTRYTRGVPAVQAGPDLYITFKFQVGVRKMTVTKDMTLWTGNTLNVQYARKDNTIGYVYKDENGYKANLTQAFIHDAGTKLITVATDGTEDHANNAFDARTKEVYGVKAAPVYAPMFEFIPQEALTKAGFSYETETINGNEYLTQLMYGAKRAAHIFKDPADKMVRLYIEYNEAGDMLYNWINTIDPTNVYNSSNNHNKVFNAEKVLNVRMVTDINDSKIEFNKFYLHDFDVKFERTLHARFTTIALNDKQAKQEFGFNFLTNNKSSHIYRGLFDEDGNLVGGQESWQTGNPLAFAKWYNVQTNVTLPVNPARPDAVDYDKVEYSEDGITWEPIRTDLRADTHPTRYFDIKWDGHSDHITWKAVWQGDEKVSTKDIYFRVPVVNEQGKAKGVDAALFRFDKARVQGYAVFKINKRK